MLPSLSNVKEDNFGDSRNFIEREVKAGGILTILFDGLSEMSRNKHGEVLTGTQPFDL